MPARPQITILGRDGEPVARIDPGGETEILDERERERVERIAQHLARPRPPRPEGGCVTPSKGHEV